MSIWLQKIKNKNREKRKENNIFLIREWLTIYKCLHVVCSICQCNIRLKVIFEFFEMQFLSSIMQIIGWVSLETIFYYISFAGLDQLPIILKTNPKLFISLKIDFLLFSSIFLTTKRIIWKLTKAIMCCSINALHRVRIVPLVPLCHCANIA